MLLSGRKALAALHPLESPTSRYRVPPQLNATRHVFSIAGSPCRAFFEHFRSGWYSDGYLATHEQAAGLPVCPEMAGRCRERCLAKQH
jgi:hypothetical protein